MTKKIENRTTQNVQIEEIAEEILPREDGEFDWGSERRVIMRNQDKSKYLFWRKGCPVWVYGTLGYIYEAGILAIIPQMHTDKTHLNGTWIAKTGKVSDHLKNVVVMKEIAEFFGIDHKDIPKLKLGKTWILP